MGVCVCTRGGGAWEVGMWGGGDVGGVGRWGGGEVGRWGGGGVGRWGGGEVGRWGGWGGWGVGVVGVGLPQGQGIRSRILVWIHITYAWPCIMFICIIMGSHGLDPFKNPFTFDMIHVHPTHWDGVRVYA
jgi:hypothetical protein